MNQNVRMVHGCVNVVSHEYVHLIFSSEEKSGITAMSTTQEYMLHVDRLFGLLLCHE